MTMLCIPCITPWFFDDIKWFLASRPVLKREVGRSDNERQVLTTVLVLCAAVFVRLLCARGGKVPIDLSTCTAIKHVNKREARKDHSEEDTPGDVSLMHTKTSHDATQRTSVLAASTIRVASKSQ
jgi:hypothetical protein